MFELVRLPQRALSVILGSWISGSALCRLDSAVCRGSERPQFLDFLKYALILLSTGVPGANTEVTNLCLKWLVRRGIKARHWIFSHDMGPCLFRDLAEHTGGPHVRNLTLSNMEEETGEALHAVFAACKRISTVSFENVQHWTGLSALRGEAELSLQELLIVNCGTSSGLEIKGKTFTNLQRLYLVGGYTASTLSALIMAAPNVTDLRLRQSLVDNTVFEALAERAIVLQTLMFVQCNVVTLDALVPACASVKTLVVSSSSLLLSTTIFAHCTLLQRFQLHDTCVLGMRDVVQRSGATLLQLSLASLNFVSDVDLFVVAEHCKRLTELELSACTGFTSAALARLVSSLPALKELALDECNAVADAVLIAIAEHLPQLEFLNLFKSSGYTEKGALALSDSLRRLRRLAIEPNHAIFTRAIVTMWEENSPGLWLWERNSAPTNCVQLHSWGCK
jgi:hypothetical protein